MVLFILIYINKYYVRYQSDNLAAVTERSSITFVTSDLGWYNGRMLMFLIKLFNDNVQEEKGGALDFTKKPARPRREYTCVTCLCSSGR